MSSARRAEAALPRIALDARMGEAARLVTQRFAPVLAAVDEAGQVHGLLREEQIRLGLAGEVRPEHPITDLLEDAPRGLPAAEDVPRVRRALVMAGGRGSRLLPLTENCPKPLLPVRGEPMLFRILQRLAAVGVEEAWISILYLGDQIRAAVGDGSRFGLRVEYLEEREPLGTAGALGLLPPSREPLFVSNGDIWTDANLASMAAWHRRHRHAVTLATHLHQVYVPFGLVHFDGQRLRRLEEKPTLRLPVNAGIYLFEPELVDEVPEGIAFDMVSWLEHLARERSVGHFPLVEEWHDVGSLEAYRELGDLPVD